MSKKKFKTGKYYNMSGSGLVVHILGEYDNIHFKKCFIAESNKSPDFIPLGNHEGAAKAWEEITEEEWDKTFKDWEDEDGGEVVSNEEEDKEEGRVFDTKIHLNKYQFQKGKYYRHDAGDYEVHILDVVDSAMFGNCCVAETNKDDNSFLSMTSDRGGAKDWHEITKEDWMDNFKIIEGKSKIWTPDSQRRLR